MDLGSPYFILLSIGFAVGCAWFVRFGERRFGVVRLALIDACIGGVVGGVVGSRLLHVAVEPLPSYALSRPERALLEAEVPRLDPGGRAAVASALSRPEVPACWLLIARMPPGAARDEAVAAAGRDPAAVPAWLWYRARPLEVLYFWKGGLAYLGGLALACVLAPLLARRQGAVVLDVADAAAPAIALGLVFGRVGCFLEGCCYGQVCEPAWWAHTPSWYPPPIGGVPRYPTALLLAAFDLALFLALRALAVRRVARGEVLLALLALYAPGRFAVEALRADPRGGALGLSTSQLLALATGVPAAIAWLALRVRAGKAAAKEGTATAAAGADAAGRPEPRA